MSSDLSPEQIELRRRLWRRTLLFFALGLSVSGYVVLAVAPETPMETAISRAFWGIGLLIAGFFMALISRVVP